MTNEELRIAIRECDCSTCRALMGLLDEAGAKLRISAINCGRFCELAVVAAAGERGLHSDAVVRERRAYAKHLGLYPIGAERNHDEPIIIRHAIKYSNHTRTVKGTGPIHLGRAQAREDSGRFFLTWTGGESYKSDGGDENAGLTDGGKKDMNANCIIVSWSGGDEQIPIDIDRLTEQTRICFTKQSFGSNDEYDIYATSSTIVKLPDEFYEIKIVYKQEANPDISESLWGTTTIILSKSDRTGTAHWDDDNDKRRNRNAQFRIGFSATAAECDHFRAIDEINERSDLTETEKQVLRNERLGHGIFRAKLLRIEKSCRLTGVNRAAHLRASHIKPWAVANNRERLDPYNGLMLSPHIDHLFDRGLISFEDNGSLLVLNVGVDELLRSWGIAPDNLPIPPRPFNAQQCGYLAMHRARFYLLKDVA